jgi:hypothetical protein
MTRTKGAINTRRPDIVTMPDEQRIALVADLILEIIVAEEV